MTPASRHSDARIATWSLVTLGRVALVDGSGSEVADLRTRPRKLALLAYLALAGRPVPRAQLVEIFWGDRDEDRARASLSEALSHLRRTLGRDALPAYSSDAGLAPGFALTVDVLDLEAAARTGDHARVLALHRGPFLDGLHIPDAATFDRWVERQRGRAADRHAVACGALARARIEAGDHDEAARLAGRWLDHAWDSHDAASLLVRALAAPGSRLALTRAAAAYRRHAQRLADELGTTPAPSLAAFARELESRIAALPPDEPAIPAIDATTAKPDVAEATATPIPAPNDACTDTDASADAVRHVGMVEATSVGGGEADALPSAWPSVERGPTVRPNPRDPRRRVRVPRTVAAVTLALTCGGGALWSLGGRDADAASVGVRERSPAAAYERAASAAWESRTRDGATALALLDSAIVLDSTRASAHLLRHRIRRTLQLVNSIDELQVAARHMDRLSGRDRLLLEGELRLAENDARALAIADTLVARFIDDREALLLAGRISLQALHLDRADWIARRVLALDAGTGWTRNGSPCTSCEAMELRLHVAWAAGDVVRCEQLASTYSARAGRTPRTLLWEATLAEGRGLWSAADSLFALAGSIRHAAADERRLRLALRAGDLDAAERRVRDWLDAGDAERRVDAQFALAQLLRERGRAREGVRELASIANASYAMQLAWGALLLDAGEPRRAAAVFADAETRWLGDGVDARSPFAARIRAWALAHEATARAAAGDTAALLPLAARIDRLGRASLLGRVTALHHWPRALLWRARGERDSTIAALRRTVLSPTQSHLRAAWLLGDELVAAGRPAEARTVIERALTGPTDAAGYYVTRRELHASRAAACAAMGDTACAAASRAWGRGPTPRARSAARRSATDAIARR